MPHLPWSGCAEKGIAPRASVRSPGGPKVVKGTASLRVGVTAPLNDEKTLPSHIGCTLGSSQHNEVISVTSKNWDRHVADAELVARSDGFRALRDRILELADPQAGDTVVDLGSGTG